MIRFSEYNKLSEISNTLMEKLVIVGKGKSSGQIVFAVGGAGSGKGFAITHFMEGEKFRVRDVDATKAAYLKLAKTKNSFPELRGLDLRTPKHVAFLHQYVKDRGITDKTLNLFLHDHSKSELPNIIFDITLQDFGKLNTIGAILMDVGYDPKNIHIVWVLTDYRLAIQQNKMRDRIVPDDILLKTHEGAANSMWEILNGGIPAIVNGDVFIILGGKSNTVFYLHPKTGKPLDGSDGRPVVVKNFRSIRAKKQGQPLIPEKVMNQELLSWILSSIPVNLDNILPFKLPGEKS